MAFIEKTAFQARITNNVHEDLANIAGLYQEDGANADCSAGLLVVRGAQTPCEGFTGIYNENTFYMTASAAGEESVIYACDTHEAQLLQGKAGAYFIGTETLGLGTPAGREGNFCRIDFDGQSVYRFGEGNISGTILDSTQFFSIYNGLLKVEASQPQSGKFFQLRGQGYFTEGTTASFKYIDVVACNGAEANHESR